MLVLPKERRARRTVHMLTSSDLVNSARISSCGGQKLQAALFGENRGSRNLKLVEKVWLRHLS